MLRSYFALIGFWLWRGSAKLGLMVWTLVRPSLRFISAVLVVAALIALTIDVTRWQTGEEGPLFLSLEQQISAAAPATLNGIGDAVSSALHPLFWDPLLTSVLRLPGWISLIVLALLLAYGARERRQVNIFIN